MKKTLLFALTLIGLLLTSCGTTYMATYDVTPCRCKKELR